MRPWLALRWGNLAFETRVLPLGGPGYGTRESPAVLAISATGTVPALHFGEGSISDSLAISEWAAEQAPSLWPSDPMARSYARAAACEMHAGFSALRSAFPCNIRRRAGARALSDEVKREVARLDGLWTQLRGRFGANGPYLFGQKTIADAFFTPVATRFRTYGVDLQGQAGVYVQTLLSDPEFREWESLAEQEPWTIPQWDAY
jgi:glutathione S-transferase